MRRQAGAGLIETLTMPGSGTTRKHKAAIHVSADAKITLDWPAYRNTLMLHIHSRRTGWWHGVSLRPAAARKLRDCCDRYLQEHGT